MELQETFYNENDYIETTSGNKINRNALLFGTQRIIIAAKSVVRENTILRGDLAEIYVGRYCIISNGVVMRPPGRKFAKGFAHVKQTIGDSVFIGPDTIMSASNVSNNVYIGKQCIIGENCIIKAYSCILDGTVLAPETTVPVYSVVAGNPGQIIDVLPDCAKEMLEAYAVDCYAKFTKMSSSNR